MLAGCVRQRYISYMFFAVRHDNIQISAKHEIYEGNVYNSLLSTRFVRTYIDLFDQIIRYENSILLSVSATESVLFILP